jgi:hypothetical protein
VPPPGIGFTTLTTAVPEVAMSDAGTVPVSWEPLTKVVANDLPFQFTTEPGTKPLPFTVREKPAPPGAVLVGTSGVLISGTGLFCENKVIVRKIKV